MLYIMLMITSYTQCGNFQAATPSDFSVHHVEEGNRLVLTGIYNASEHTWNKDGKALALKSCTAENDRNCAQHRIFSLNSSQGFPTIVFREVTIQDSGKYILEMAQPRRRAHSYGIIVRKKSSVFIDCLDMTANEDDSVTCICRANSLADSVVTWVWSKEEEHNTSVKYSTDILALKNVSRHQSGTYTCFVQKPDLKSSFHLKVEPKDERVRITYFKAFQEVNVADAKRVLICKAEGIPEPKYTILHRGIAVNYETSTLSMIKTVLPWECSNAWRKIESILTVAL